MSIPYYCPRPFCKGKLWVDEQTSRTEQHIACSLCGRNPFFKPKTISPEEYQELEASFNGLDYSLVLKMFPLPKDRTSDRPNRLNG